MKIIDRSDFILELPHITSSTSFDGNVIRFFLAVLLLLIGISICVKGYKWLFALIIAMCSALGAGTAAIWADHTMGNPVISLVVFVTILFMLICLMYGLQIVISKPMRSLIKPSTQGNLFVLIAAIIGPACIVAVIYYMVYQNGVFCILLCIILAVASSYHGYTAKKKVKPFHTYDELYNIDHNGSEG